MKLLRSAVLALMATLACSPVFGQYDAPVADLYEKIARRGSDFVEATSTTVYRTMAGDEVVSSLRKGDRVHRLRQSTAWTRIRTIDGKVGYVRTEDLSDRWVFISKNRHMLYVYEGLDLLLKIPVDLAVNYIGDKIRRGSHRNPEDWRTPEGVFYVSWKRNSSIFYKALVLSYPAPQHASRGLREGLISQPTFARIVKANQMLQSPPMNTILGGWIEIHGHGVDGRANWTRGCVALENDDIDLLWKYVSEGTPVLVGSFSRLHAQDEPYVIAHRLPSGTPMRQGTVRSTSVELETAVGTK